MRLLPCNRGGQPEGEIRLAIMVGESIYANVRLRLTANRTYRLHIIRELKITTSRPFSSLIETQALSVQFHLFLETMLPKKYETYHIV